MSQNIVDKNIENNVNNINKLNSTIETLLDKFYPVGSIYISLTYINPGEIMGGTWIQMDSCFLWASKDKTKLGSKAGEQTHTLTLEEMPKHRHDFSSFNYNTTKIQFFNADSSGGLWINDNQFMIAAKRRQASTQFPDVLTTDNLLLGLPIQYSGSSQPHNNMPPYITVNMWYRQS